ncbi:MAG TPA: helix-turn-helix transcriptional regulator [Roseiarcus sp.]|nr:helix-turn-helix transcriptional regulator [Roseiarcus sp.]
MRTSGDGEMLGVDDQASPADAETFADGDAVAEIAAPSGRRAKPMGRRWTDRPKTSISPEQVKAARELLGWSQDDLAALVGVGETAVSLFEREKRRLLALNVSEVRGVLESAGIEFTGGAQPGAALRPGFETGEQALVLAQRHRRANRPRQEAPSVAPEAEAELEADGAEAMPLDQFLSGLEAYEERRLRPQGIRVGNRGGTKFGFALFYMNRDAASLMLEGKELGRVRWAKGKIEFDPAITRSNPAHTLEDDLDQWASRAYARSLGA